MKRLLLAAFVCFFLFSCSKKDTVDNQTAPQITVIPGFGDTQGEIPDTAFALPQGIQLQGSITGNESMAICQAAGFGTLVDVYLTLKNTTGGTVKIVFPAGLTLKSVNTADQNGIVAQTYEISIAGGASCFVKLGAYCINSSRHAASSGSVYTWGPVCNAPAIVYLLQLLKNKDLSKDDYSATQGMVWEVSQMDVDPQASKAVWDDVKTQIASMPDK